MANCCQNVRGNKLNKEPNDNNKKTKTKKTAKREEGTGVEKANN